MPMFVLLTIGWYPRFWWAVQEPNLNCTAKQREEVLRSTLTVTSFFLLDERDPNVNHTTPGIVRNNKLRQCTTMWQ